MKRLYIEEAGEPSDTTPLLRYRYDGNNSNSVRPPPVPRAPRPPGPRVPYFRGPGPRPPPIPGKPVPVINTSALRRTPLGPPRSRAFSGPNTPATAASAQELRSGRINSTTNRASVKLMQQPVASSGKPPKAKLVEDSKNREMAPEKTKKNVSVYGKEDNILVEDMTDHELNDGDQKYVEMYGAVGAIGIAVVIVVGLIAYC